MSIVGDVQSTLEVYSYNYVDVMLDKIVYTSNSYIQFKMDIRYIFKYSMHI